jgi:hypothetical protein
MNRKLIIVLFCLLAMIGYVKYAVSKDKTYFSIDLSKGSQVIYLDTDSSQDDFRATVHCELKGEINTNIEVLLASVDIPLNEPFVPMRPYNLRLKKGYIDTTFGGDWYTNKARLLLRFPPNCEGKIKGYLSIDK